MAIRHDIHTRIYLNDDWRDVSSDVRVVSDGVQITRGRPDEAGETPPQTCNFTLNNRSGDYSVRNPTGQWYGYLGRGNPVEVCKYLAQDTASTAVTGGWGTTETGTSTALSTYSWTVTGGAVGDYAKAAGKATHSVTSTNVRRLSYLAAFTQRDVDITLTWSINVTNITGASVTTDVVLRGTSLAADSQVVARMYVTTAEAIQVDFVNGSGTTWTSQPLTVDGITHTSSQELKIRAQAEGQSYRVKVWVATAGEPLAWSKTWTNPVDTAALEAIAYTTGWVGVGSQRTTSNSNGTVTFSYDDIIIASPRFAGEVANYTTDGDASARERSVHVEAAGVIRRLLQGRSPLLSAPRRAIPNDPEVTYYWPVEDGPLAVVAKPVVGDVELLSLSLGVGSSSVFGEGNLAPWLPNGAILQDEVLGVAAYELDQPLFNAADGWRVEYYRQATQIDDDTDSFYVSDDVDGLWLVTINHSTGNVSLLTPYGTDNTTSTALTSGEGIWIRLAVSGSGTVTWSLAADDVEVIGNAAAGSASAVRQLVFTGGPRGLAIGQIAVYHGNSSTVIPNAMQGYAGEKVGDRLVRLCLENDIEFTWIGDLTETVEMGPQAPLPLIDLLRECAAADQGTLFESKGSVGLTYRTLSSAYTQEPIITLDASSGEVGYPFEPVEDDLLVVNKVLARQKYGSDYEVEQTTGPLSSANPPDGVGRYDTQVEVNVDEFSDVPGVAEWRLALGTVDEPRFPGLWIDLDAPDSQQFEDEVLDLTPDDLMTITNADDVGIYDDINVLARGYAETWTSHRHTVQLNASPYGPYNVLVLDSGRLDAEEITINEDLDTTETGVGTAISAGHALWNTADLPYDVVVGGERMTATAVSGASSPQTLTVTRSVNDVVKTHSTGAEILLAVPYYLGK